MAELPPEVVQALNVLALFLVVQGIKALVKYAPFLENYKLEGQASVIALWLAGAVVTYGNNALALVPAEYQPIAVSALGLLSLIFGAAGLYKTIGDLKPQDAPVG